MVRVREGVVDNIPSLSVVHFMFIKEDPQKFDSRNRGMCIIKLDLIFLCELRPIIAMVLLISTDDVLKRGCAEEVLLLQTELFSAWSRVIRIEDTSDILSGLTLSDSSKVVTRIERVKVEFIAGTTSPKAQVVGVIGVVAGDGSVISLGHDELPINPGGSLDAMLIILINTAIEADRVDDI